MVDLERLRDNLKYIRRGRGLTFAKLAECQYVMEALGDVPLRVAYERLAGMVRMLGEDVRAMALHNAYAIDMPAPDTLTRRRERIAGIMGSVSTPSSCTNATCRRVSTQARARRATGR